VPDPGPGSRSPTALLLRRSRWGYALVRIGEDEERALTLGIDTTRVKGRDIRPQRRLHGRGGAAWRRAGPISTPRSSTRFVSFQTVIMALVGGATTVVGPALGRRSGLVSELFLLRFRYVYMLGWG